MDACAILSYDYIQSTPLIIYITQHKCQEIKSSPKLFEYPTSPLFLTIPKYSTHDQISESAIIETLKQYLPKITFPTHYPLAHFLKDEQLFFKIQKTLENHQQIISRIEWLELQQPNKQKNIQDNIGKKITRAALARKLEKTQQQIKKDQIFVRLTPKSQTCIQFMLSNRNFPRMQCKLSCNQHLQYLINYLTNKWIRGKMGYKVVLFPDTSFLKSLPFSEKEKALKDPLDNYLMFTDLMVCCGVGQNGALNLTYQILEVKKNQKPPKVITSQQSNNVQIDNKIDLSHLRNNQTPVKKKLEVSALPSLYEKPQQSQRSYDKNQYRRQASVFKHSNFFLNHDQSMFGSLGFNFNQGFTQRNPQMFISQHSINFIQNKERQSQNKNRQLKLEIKLNEQSKGCDFFGVKHDEDSYPNNQYFQKRENNYLTEIKKQDSESKEPKSLEKKDDNSDKKLGNLLSFLEKIQKEKQVEIGPQQSQNNISNKIKDVKMVTIVKKKTNT